MFVRSTKSSVLLSLVVVVVICPALTSCFLRFVTQSQKTEPYVTRRLKIEHVVSTVVESVAKTLVVYPTCTTTSSGVMPCPHHTLTSMPATRTPVQYHSLTREVGGTSESHNLMEVVLPSCDCEEPRWGARGYSRSPRHMKEEEEEQVVTFRTTTTIIVEETVTTTDASTTVSITYGGCVPDDALLTTACASP
ncbi:hypothetical protein Pmani_026799 [Petrolisthes manimaculis]|uniref:Uncharacterized protein n=1 Tax=Petrolisthes manimaculis TaxID=1843537 RepID=A0AAE1P5H9_9EUCA|nr:hypothetical protein Pmani_026799 [Petrolisthes manimaculis]